MAAVELSAIDKSFGTVHAVKEANIRFNEGSFTTLLGPSGCGKTTILRMIAGLETPSQGDIYIGGRRINDIPIHRRNLGLVFQNYALFPHKTVAQNIAFGLKYRGIGKAEANDKVRQALNIVRLPGVEQRLPSQLSGGQQQRIALARAIVIQPDVLLLDEPLSALDANLREEMRVELKSIQRNIGITTIFVTHDQAEALALSDQVVVMNSGTVEQIGSPQIVYGQPDSEFVARFLGNANLLEGSLSETTDDGIKLSIAGLDEVILPRAVVRGQRQDRDELIRVVIRAEHIRLGSQGHNIATDDALCFMARISAVDYQGQLVRYFLHVGGLQLEAMNIITGVPLQEGEVVRAKVSTNDIIVL